MGEVFFFNLPHLIKTYSADVFFETGTGFGFGVMVARLFAFRQIYSVDIVASEVAKLQRAFARDPRVKLFSGRSIDAMREFLPNVSGNIIFWLDAHYPGAHHELAGYDSEKDIGTRLPLEQEMSLIKQLRPNHRDVLLIDDLRIYEHDKFQEGSLRDLGMESITKFNSEFLYKMFEQTHSSHRYLNHTGYLALLPKDPPSPS